MPEENSKKLKYLQTEEVRTMEKDIVRLREADSEVAREKIAQIRTGEETGIEMERIEQSRKAAEERERLEMESKRKEEEIKRIRAEEIEKGKLLEKEKERREESEKEELRKRLKEAQLKEAEERKKFLENVTAKAGGDEEIPIPPPIPQRLFAPPPPLPKEVPPDETEIWPTPSPLPPTPPTPVPPPAPAKPVIPPSLIEVPAPPTPPKPKKSFKFSLPPFHLPSFHLPSIKIPRPKIPKPKLPSVKMPEFTGYFPGKPSVLGKIWIRIIVSLFILAILATIVTFWYWYLVIREKGGQTIPTPGKPAIEKTVEATAPLPLIPTENVVTLEITNPAELPNLLSQALEESLDENKFTRILIKNTAENNFLGLREFFEAFQVATPENFYSNIDNDFTLFIFSSFNKNRLGLTAKTQNPAVFRSILESWEQTLEGDTDNLFVFLGKKELNGLTPFQKFTYKNDVIIHYLSFPEENFGICWAITGNYFIFTSSGESIVKTIDKIKE